MAIDPEVLQGIKDEAERVVKTYGDSWSPTYVKRRAAETLALVAEVERLQRMEERLKSLMEHKRQSIAEDRRIAAEEGVSWLGINSRTIAANMTDTELQNLERVLGN